MHKISLVTIVRLGLRQFTTGIHTVLVLGILNRIMKVEMGLDMTLVSVVICAFYFIAPVAVPLGHRSDTRPYRGYHRTPYILVGMAITALTTALSPFVAFFMAAQHGSPISSLAGLGLFLIMGVGMYMSTTAFVSLIADLTTEEEHGKVTSIVWAIFMFGILAGAILSSRLLAVYTPEGLVRLFLIGAGILVVFTLISVVGLEKPYAAVRPSKEAISFRQALALMGGSSQAQLFFALVFCVIFFLFLQQVVLEPFGGDVFGLSVRQTTMFNVYQVVGTLVGMGAAGWLIKQFGPRRTLAAGAFVAMAAYAWMALAAMLRQAGWLPPAIIVMGVGMGLLNVAGITMMLGMTIEGHAGLYLGAWTLAEALARGLAGIAGGGLFDLAQLLGSSMVMAYAAVFAVESLGCLLPVVLVARVNPSRFRAESASTLTSLKGQQVPAISL